MEVVSIKELYSSKDRVELFLFNVGQGDHIMLKFPNHEYGLIDFHYDAKQNIMEPPCLTYFKSLKSIVTDEEFNKITISFLCISHTDKDHVKGVCETIEWFYKNNIFIKEFWLGAARDENQMSYILRNKIPNLLNDLTIEDKFKYIHNIDLLNSGIESFFKHFELWKRKEFKNKRYQEEAIGTGEYLVDIKPLRRPSSSISSSAINLGPLSHHLDNFVNCLNSKLLVKILGSKDETKIDKNDISHIIKMRIGDTNLIFGGDTHKKVWLECLERYESIDFNYHELFGQYTSSFIKVSHHGSKKSSATKIWKKLTQDKNGVYFAISAGNNASYKHPNSKTLEDINMSCQKPNINSTNLCKDCISQSNLDKEYHIWYDECIKNSSLYFKNEMSSLDRDIEYINSQLRVNEPDNNTLGLLAYIYQIPLDNSEEITVKLALTTKIKSNNCFFQKHKFRLCEYCYKDNLD